ncbi:MAG: PAS domain S-box protein [Vicinamibacterales bacterium]
MWDAGGGIVLELPARGPGDTAPEPPSRPPAPGTGEIQAAARGAFADTAVAITSPDGTALGTLSLRSPLAINPPDLLQRLIGDDARIVFGNRRGSGWTDLSTAVDLSAVDAGSDAIQRYRHADGDERIGAVASFGALAPWVVWVEFPRASVVAGADRFLRNSVLLGAAVALVSLLLVRRVVTGFTAPLSAMTDAAESMAAGQYDGRVATTRGDEIGRLGRAFDRMAGTVEHELAARRRAVDVAASTEGRYRTLFDYAPDGILIADAEGRHLDANPGICRILGRTRDELVGGTGADIVASDELPHIGPALAALGGDVDYQREWRLRHRDGSIVEADVIATRMPDGHILATFRDVTDRNRAQRDARAAEERMRFALESADVGIWERDFRTGAVRWSEILEAQYGLAPGTFAGSHEAFLAMVHPDDQDQVRRGFDAAMRKGGEFSVQHRIVRPDGSQRWITGVGLVLLSPDGAPRRAVGVSLDVTAQHQLEVQFQQAQKMEAVGRLAGGVAHDFNNLLTAILGYCELVLDELPPQHPMRFEISEIEKAGRQAGELTRQLLAFSRKQIIEPTVLDVNAVVRGLQSMLRRLIREDVEVTVTLAGEPMLINADRGQIEQVVINLAVNARDAMPTGGRLTIETAIGAADDDPRTPVARLTVADTGDGMTEEVRRRIFEPFFTTKGVGKGTGLGLAVVDGAVAQCGGGITVESAPGAGTTFRLWLPLVAADGLATAGPTMSIASRGAETVLVVEDDDAVRGVVRLALTMQGFTVLEASGGEAAVHIAEEHPGVIHLLLSDVVMPEMGGRQVLEAIRQRRPGIRALFMSGYTDDAVLRHGVVEAADAFIQKPFTPLGLARKVRQVIDGEA